MDIRVIDKCYFYEGEIYKIFKYSRGWYTARSAKGHIDGFARDSPFQMRTRFFSIKSLICDRKIII